jgi:hypothetical protein
LEIYNRCAGTDSVRESSRTRPKYPQKDDCESGLQWFSSTAEGRLGGECLVGARNFGQANDVRDGFYEFVAAHALWPAIAGNIHPNDSARPFFISFPRVRQARRSLL